LGRPGEAYEIVTHTLLLVPADGTPSHGLLWGLQALSLAASGDTAAASERLARIEEARVGPGHAFAAGLVHAALGDVDAAFRSFDRVQRWGPLETEQFRYYFPDVLGPLREDPRWERQLRAVDRSWGLRGEA
ncbi:MAG: hypothetical protein R3266_07540, partial [Gemmatimonadota bacterium]|nr:hypothetical protein [Gemmatimonadota bacterium]